MNLYKIILSLTTLLMALIFFLNMQSHHSWSCFLINIMLACCIATIDFEETSKMCLTHHDWRGDLLVSHPHIGYSVQKYICKAF